MKKLIYPIILTKSVEKGNEFYHVEFLDFIGEIYTNGDTIIEALDNAREAFFLHTLDNNIDELPKPTTNFKKIILKKNEMLSLLDIDIEEFQKIKSNKIVNTTVTMPQWLKTIAEKENINFSYVLQQALKEKLELNK